MLRVHVLGPIRLSGAHQDEPRLSQSLQRLIALLAAVGPDGIDRNSFALELWGEPLPESWKSALRNRITSARRLLGPDSILTGSGYIKFAPHLRVDSWDLIAHQTAAWGDEQELAFLDSEPLLGVQMSQTLQRHVAHIAEARASILKEVATNAPEPLSPRALQSLRNYHRLHILDAAVARETISAHVRAGETQQALTIIAEIKSHTTGAMRRAHPWVAKLDSLIVSGTPQRRAEDREPKDDTDSDVSASQNRAELFAAAARDEDWNVALEIAMSGLPEASRHSGDPERLKLLESIPLDKLDPARRFNLSLSMTRHLLYAGREDEAHDFAVMLGELAETPDEQVVAFYMRAIVGDTPDERSPLPLPKAFETAQDLSVNMQSLQVAVTSHLERSSFAEAARMHHRFNDLVEACGDPYRRWHMLLLQSMVHFVEGDLAKAAESSTRAAKYAEVFGIADADFALLCQQSNAHWVHPGFARPETYPADPAASELGRALTAAHTAYDYGCNAVDLYLKTFNWRSKFIFTFPTLMAVARYIRDDDLRKQVAERLKRRTGTSAIWGSGLMHFGPVDRTLAQLSSGSLDQEMHAAAAVEVADRQKNRIWQVVCRLDLGAITGNPEHQRRAEALANTDALVTIVQNYEPIF